MSEDKPFWTNYAVHDEENIQGFFGEYRWLSNFHPCDVKWNGIEFPSSEHAYQFAKTAGYEVELSPHIVESVKRMTASEVKRWGKTQFIRPDWDSRKVSVMVAILLDKFMRNPELKEKLLATGDRWLEETNHWKDDFWGVRYDTREGKNHLGYSLMFVREILRT